MRTLKITYLCYYPGQDAHFLQASFLTDETAILEIPGYDLTSDVVLPVYRYLLNEGKDLLIYGPIGPSRKRRAMINVLRQYAPCYVEACYLAGMPDGQDNAISPPTLDEGFDDIQYISEHMIWGLLPIEHNLPYFELAKDIPELIALKDLEHDHPKHRETIGSHIQQTYRLALYHPDPAVAKDLAAIALMHDLGKLWTREYDPKKKYHTYINHPSVSACYAAAYWPIEKIVRLVKYHDLIRDPIPSVIAKVAPPGYEKDLDLARQFLEIDDLGRN